MNDDQNGVVTLKVRVTPEFREKIVDTAKANNRSMNQEIVDRLEKSFDSPPQSDEQKEMYSFGVISGAAKGLSAIYQTKSEFLTNQYKQKPNRELYLEILKYKFLTEKLESLGEKNLKDFIFAEIKELNTPYQETEKTADNKAP